MFLFQSSHARIAIFREPDNTKMRVFDASLPTRNMKPRQKSGLKSKGNAQFAGPGYRNSVSLTRWNTVEGGAVRKRQGYGIRDSEARRGWNGESNQNLGHCWILRRRERCLLNHINCRDNRCFDGAHHRLSLGPPYRPTPPKIF